MTDPIYEKNSPEASNAGAITDQELVQQTDSASLLAKIDEHLKEYTKQNASSMTESITQIVSDALGRVKSRYVDTDRIPLLCQSVFSIQDKVKELKQMLQENRKISEEQHEKFVTKSGEYALLKLIVFTTVGLALIAVAKLILDSVLK